MSKRACSSLDGSLFIVFIFVTLYCKTKVIMVNMGSLKSFFNVIGLSKPFIFNRVALEDVLSVVKEQHIG